MRLPRRLCRGIPAALLAALLALTPSWAVLAPSMESGGALIRSGQIRLDPEEGNAMSVPAEEHHAQVSPGVRNIVKRARQLTDIVWTPAQDVEGWCGREANRFLAGRSYTGLPYGQPHRSGSYVPWQTGLPEFLRQLQDPQSAMYTGGAVSQVKRNTAPYFSCECSAFVSWAWGLPQRQTTHTLDRYAVPGGTRIEDLQVGDCMVKVGKHARLVTDIVYDERGAIRAIEIAEEHEPAARRLWYRADSQELPLSALQTENLDKGFVILRCESRDSVGYTHSCAVPLKGDVCPRCGANPFRDLKLEKWYASAVAYMNNQGLMTGTSPDTFSPNEKVTRAMLVTVLWRMYHSPSASGKLPFRDVAEDAYCHSALCWAWSRGFVSGTGDGSFDPEAKCTKAQLVASLWKAAGSPAPQMERCPFRDVKQNAYYYRALCWALEEGIVVGQRGEAFAPKSGVTRAEAAAMLWRACICLRLFP